MNEQEPTPEQQLITSTTNFAQTLLTAGCPIEFICTQSFKYAMCYQKQVDINLDFIQNVMHGREPSLPDPENTVYMDNAAKTLVQVVTTLGIHPNQIKSEHPYHDHHMIERYP